MHQYQPIRERQLGKVSIDRPIFLVGNARSGSTVFYHLCAGHPHVAWFSNFTERFKGLPQLACLSPLFPWRQLNPLPRWVEIFIPKPAEGQPLYALCSETREENSSEANQPIPYQPECIRNLLSKHLKYHRRSRFLNKNIKNWRQVSLLDEMFPDAKFIHIVRDPRANVASYLNWWLRPGHQQIWREGNYPPGEWETRVKPLIVRLADLWVEVNGTIAESQRFLNRRYARIAYEELTTDPFAVMERVLEHCELSWTDGYRNFIQRSSIENMNGKYRGQFTGREFRLIEEITAPLVKKLGYNYF